MSEVSITNSDPTLAHNFKGHKKPITDLGFHPDTKQLASSSHDNSIMLWNIFSKNVRCYSFTGHTDTVTSLEFSVNGQLLVSASQDSTVRLWIPTVKGGSTFFKAHSAAVRCVTFSPDNEKLTTGSNDKCIKTWDVQKRRFLTSYTGHNNWVRCVKHSSDSKTIASCADDRTLRVWDTNSGQCIHTFPTTKGSGNHLSIHPNGNSIALAMSTGSVRIYDIRALKLQQHYLLHDNTKSVAWHPYANYLLTCGNDGTMRIVDVMEGRPLYTLKGHDSSVESAVFSKDGNYFASGGTDKYVKVWKTNFVSKDDCPSSSSTSQDSA